MIEKGHVSLLSHAAYGLLTIMHDKDHAADIAYIALALLSCIITHP
jgi:hypothetical protein